MIKVVRHFDAGLLRSQAGPVNPAQDDSDSLVMLGDFLSDQQIELLGQDNLLNLKNAGCLKESDQATQFLSGDGGNGESGKPEAPALKKRILGFFGIKAG